MGLFHHWSAASWGWDYPIAGECLYTPIFSEWTSSFYAHRKHPTTRTRMVVHPYAAHGTLSSSLWRKSSRQGSTTLPASIWIRCTQMPQSRKKSYICNVTHHFHISHYLWGMKRAISYHSWLILKYQLPLTWYKIGYLLPFYASPWQQPLPPSYITKPLSLKCLHQLITLQNFITQNYHLQLWNNLSG